MSRFTSFTLASFTLATLLLTGCKETSTAELNTTTEPAAATWLLASAPEDAKSVSEAKASAKEGEQIVLRGRIGGRLEPLTEGSPVFTMMDLAVPACGTEPDDHCRTPWDYCCETPETITANSATVQIMDAHGHPISESPTARGLAALDEVIVVGTVAARPSENVLTIQATGIYRVGG